MPLILFGNWIPKPLATPFVAVHLVHSRLTPTRCFSETSPSLLFIIHYERFLVSIFRG
ncbi:MAG: hypothetical protein LBK82_00085 [Planctomycetaceae bacterium]|nr:hypothetical protein [Planctomycetaceae bacterium]